jgi:hypothetical protein
MLKNSTFSIPDSPAITAPVDAATSSYQNKLRAQEGLCEITDRSENAAPYNMTINMAEAFFMVSEAYSHPSPTAC